MHKAAFVLIFLASPLQAETHQVRMLTRGDGGAMIYEPALLKIAPGDTVQFISAQPGHNAATIEGMIPKGAEPFKSPIGKDFSVTLTTPGTYGIKCSPHFAMGMVMLIQVGTGQTPDLPTDLPARARQRFDTILAAQ